MPEWGWVTYMDGNVKRATYWPWDGSRHWDVTAEVRASPRVSARNDALGCDPAPGKHKKLVITYQPMSGPHRPQNPKGYGYDNLAGPRTTCHR
eukprot:Skav201504  [mRNA]  locus=scaffold1154:251688:251966:+ [translate_table: standard]